jgi:membrane-associated phospholipid phosphatase
MNKPDLFQARWRWGGLIACNLVAVAVLASWLRGPTRQLWNLLDTQLFHLLNAPLASSSAWAHVWAVANMRPVDIGVALIMLGLIIKSGWVFSGVQVRRALYGFLMILALLLLIRVGFAELVKIMHWERASPSLTVDGAARLTKIFPDWETRWYMKDSSGRSFPGDHASVLLLWAMFLSQYARGRQLLLVWGLIGFFMLPRLVAGAHWASDDFVGGLAVSLIAFGWGFYSPYAAKASALLERLGAPIMRSLGKLPGLNRVSLISGR